MEPVIELRIPLLLRPPILAFPARKVGPLGLIEIRRVEPGGITPVELKPIRKLRGYVRVGS